MSDDRTDNKFNIFIYEPVPITLKPDEPNPLNNPSTGMREISNTRPSLDWGSDGFSYETVASL
jgi:hypothetical protein